MKRSTLYIFLVGAVVLSTALGGAVIAKAEGDNSGSFLTDSGKDPAPSARSTISCPASDQRNSNETLSPPNYATFSPPVLGGSYCDTTFGTLVERISASGSGYATNSKVSYFSIDDSYFIANDEGGIYLYGGQDGQRIRELGMEGIEISSVRWPRANYYTVSGNKVVFDPEQHLYYYEGNEIRLYNVKSMTYDVLNAFSEYAEIGPAGGEGDISQDGRYWILDGRKSDGDPVLFVYDLLGGVKESECPFDVGDVAGEGIGVDNAVISPSGKYIVIAWNADRYDPFVDDLGQQHFGSEVFDRATWEFQRRILPTQVDFDLGFDSSGNEVLFAMAGNTNEDLASFAIPDLDLGDVISVQLADGFGLKLLDVPDRVYQTMGFASGRNEYVFVGFSAGSNDPQRDWAPYWGEILAIPTDGSGQIARLVHHRSRKVGDMAQQAFQPAFNVNNAGDRIVFQSTYGLCGTDLYLFDFEKTIDPPTFIDVPLDHPFHNEIEVLYRSGYTSGCNSDPLMYCPEHILNRAESAVFVARGIYGPQFTPVLPVEATFDDVPLEAWYADWIDVLWKDGYTAGCGTEPLIYCPDQEQVRANGCVFYLRMINGADYEPPPAKGYFKDVDPQKWYAKWVDAAWEAGIVEPCATEPDMLFCPEDPLTRAEAASMLVKSMGLTP